MGRRRGPRDRGRKPDRRPREALRPTLDLHGDTADEATRRTERWLRAQQAAGTWHVRVVTGRGLRSLGPPVLRGEVEALLDRLRETVVASFASDAGGGAFDVELRRSTPQPGRRAGRIAPVARRIPPDLRRRAEEALWELGVTPTPELVAAEIRRLLEENEGA